MVRLDRLSAIVWSQRGVRGWALSLVTVAIAFAIRTALGSYFDEVSFLPFYPALAITISRLQSATRLQESLFHELQHRVANNMQFVAAMLQQAERNVRDTEAAQMLGRRADTGKPAVRTANGAAHHAFAGHAARRDAPGRQRPGCYVPNRVRPPLSRRAGGPPIRVAIVARHGSGRRE